MALAQKAYLINNNNNNDYGYVAESEFGGALLPHRKSPPTTTTPITQHPISRIWKFRVIFSNAAMRN
jgi:hypothetical protein